MRLQKLPFLFSSFAALLLTLLAFGLSPNSTIFHKSFQAHTGWLTDSASCRLGVSMTVSTKSAAFRETAAGLESPSWNTLGKQNTTYFFVFCVLFYSNRLYLAKLEGH